MLIRWQSTIVDRRGNVQPGAVLTIRRMSDQAIVTVYRDRDGTQPYPTGTVTADENGYAYFYALPGLYRITSIKPSIDWPDVNLSAVFVTVGGGPFETVQEGLDATEDGDFFSVAPSGQRGGLFDLYENSSGSALLIGTFPSLEAVNGAVAIANQALEFSFTREPARWSPYDSDSDGSDGAIVDAEGWVIGGVPAARVLSSIKDNEALIILAPYDSDADDSDGGILDIDGWVIGGLPTVGGGEVTATLNGPMYVTADFDSRTLAFTSWFGANRWWRVHLAPHGPNNIINVDHFEDVAGPDITAAGTVVAVTSTDWFPPRQDAAVTGGDATSKVSTGGSHEVGGETTAQTVSHYMVIDGRRLLAGETFSGYAKRVRFGWQDEVTSYNTTLADGDRRFTKDVYTDTIITPLSIEAFIETWAREAITVYRDGGFQMTGNGFDTSGHHYNDTAQARIPKASFTNSASKTAAPNVWATSLYQPGRGFQTSWINRGFGFGDASQVAGSWPLAYRNSGGTWKFYHSVVERQDGSFTMAAGDSYAFHGGYTWSPDGVQGAADSAFLFTKHARPSMGYAFLSAGSSNFYADESLIGLETDAGVFGRFGLSASAVAYETAQTEIKA
ncbi:hypothetical protein [Bordetella sp. BOR01]|uniref:hypothetical protein n=1 Tax=Bordetella sp. BOR01 TaxID=2854779 RepID=UPI001C479FE6|nr:hypothetical protein [Bordetella sp. BOR01]MBV7482532.1 hypothetical protein [Bordetella sp. BOR01]